VDDLVPAPESQVDRERIDEEVQNHKSLRGGQDMRTMRACKRKQKEKKKYIHARTKLRGKDKKEPAREQTSQQS